MLDRLEAPIVEAALRRQAAVALIGPRQVGKTTLALRISENRPSVYLDLESPVDKEKLADPVSFLRLYQDKLVILDEIHRLPEIFQVLRGIIDEGRRMGKGKGRFLILGSASIDLLRQSGESLAGRIEYVDMGTLSVDEVGVEHTNSLWVRGGFPDAFLAESDADSFELRNSFIRTYLERDVAIFGPRVPSETLNRLWRMLAHHQGGMLNASTLAKSLEISSPTIGRYIDLLVDLLLVRKLTPYAANTGKRLMKSPKVYVRDSGLLHALLGISNLDDLFGNPVVGTSWEGFVIENLLSAAPRHTQAGYYRTSAGAEIDLVLELGGGKGTWAIEVKRSSAAKVTRGFRNAIEDIQPTQSFVVYAGEERYPKGAGVEAIGLNELVQELKQ